MKAATIFLVCSIVFLRLWYSVEGNLKYEAFTAAAVVHDSVGTISPICSIAINESCRANPTSGIAAVLNTVVVKDGNNNCFSLT